MVHCGLGVETQLGRARWFLVAVLATGIEIIELFPVCVCVCVCTRARVCTRAPVHWCSGLCESYM